MGVEAYRYRPPHELGAAGYLEIYPIDTSDPRLTSHAWVFQRIMNVAWVQQFEGQLAPEDIAQSVDPKNPDLRAAQTERLAEEQIAGQPVYVRAQIMDSSVSQGSGSGLVPVQVGVGKSKTAGRPSEPILADISDVYVIPEYQSHGIGTSIYRSLLDGFSPEQQLAAYEFAANLRTLKTLERLGYSSIKSWNVEQFGQQMEQTYLRGPLVGDMIEGLERKNPWLAEREPIS